MVILYLFFYHLYCLWSGNWQSLYPLSGCSSQWNGIYDVSGYDPISHCRNPPPNLSHAGCDQSHSDISWSWWSCRFKQYMHSSYIYECDDCVPKDLIIIIVWHTRFERRDRSKWGIGTGLWIHADSSDTESVGCAWMEFCDSVISSGWVDVSNGSSAVVFRRFVVLNLKALYRVSPIAVRFRPTNGDACTLCRNFKWPTRSGWWIYN